MNYIETQRLILRDWNNNDLPGFIEMNRDEKVMEYFLKPLIPEESTAYYQRICDEFQQCGYGLYAVEVKESGEFIGYIGLHHPTYDLGWGPCIEIGWRLAANAWGKGYATEGATACLKYAFRQLHLSRVYSFTSLPNKRSERVMQKIGMQKVGEFDHPLVPYGHPLLRHVLYMAEGLNV